MAVTSINQKKPNKMKKNFSLYLLLCGVLAIVAAFFLKPVKSVRYDDEEDFVDIPGDEEQEPEAKPEKPVDYESE